VTTFTSERLHTGLVGSDAERHHFRRLEPAFRDAETDEEPSPAGRRRRIADANRRRAERGIPPLRDDPEDPPELALYRRARALGRRRRRG
jgi:hypothetical protein